MNLAQCSATKVRSNKKENKNETFLIPKGGKRGIPKRRISKASHSLHGTPAGLTRPPSAAGSNAEWMAPRSSDAGKPRLLGFQFHFGLGGGKWFPLLSLTV